MLRRSTPALLLAIVVLAPCLGGCRPDTVELGFEPKPGATYRYRYEIDLHLERALEGEMPTVTDVDSVITASVTVLETTPDGVRSRLVIRRDGGDDQTLTVLIDRAGSLRGIEEFAELPSDTFGVGDLLTLSVAPPPTGPVAIGDTWTFGDEPALERPITGEARLDRFGVVDGEKVAKVGSELRQALDDEIDAGPSGAHVNGEVRSDASTSYDLADGAVRRSQATATGDVDVLIQPPAGSTATPAKATITYELDVRTTRLS